MRRSLAKMDDLLTPVTRAGSVTQTSMADTALIVGANEEQITAVVAAATAVLTKYWSNKSEATSVTISAPI
jgi:hypothetical protein